jgi:predicted ATPase
MAYLESIALKNPVAASEGFPFTLPVVRSLPEVSFRAPVTFFVGENGSGKSTLLEAIAAGIPLPSVGSEELDRDDSMGPARLLGDALRYRWAKKTRHGFFLRAEDFFNFGARVKALIAELERQVRDYEEELEGRPFAEGMVYAIGSAKGQIQELKKKYGDDLNARSHGESFLKLFEARITPNGLYLLDEPEAPLSPLRQLAFLSILKQKVGQGCQFLIATHSPILLAYPDALIYSFDSHPVGAVEYESLEHVTLTRDFLCRPGAFLRRL